MRIDPIPMISKIDFAKYQRMGANSPSWAGTRHNPSGEPLYVPPSVFIDYPSLDMSSLPSTIPYELPLEEYLSYLPSFPCDSPSGQPSRFLSPLLTDIPIDDPISDLPSDPGDSTSEDPSSFP